jgi:radical SAM superfamily enzyme YgiQ (UPF0313 family)
VIILYNPWSTPSPKKPLPMSLLAVASMLDPDAYTIVDANLYGNGDDPVDVIARIGREQVLTAIAVTVMPGPQLLRAVADCRRLKQTFPSVPIVWGGYFPSQHADTCLRAPYVDICVRSQGEHTFRELVDVLMRGGSLSGIGGLSYRENGHVRHNPGRPLIPMDSLPEWPYDRVPMTRYLHNHYLGRRVASHHSSFGCPFACNFCAVVAMSSQRWLPESPARMERVVSRFCQEYGADAIQFHDMDFFVSESRTAEFADRIARFGIRWWGLGRVDELMRYSDRTWQKMRQSGLTMVFCGAESGSDAVLARMNKGGRASASLTLELARRARRFGIVPEFSFVLGNPPDAMADTEATLRFVREVKNVNPEAEIILYTYTPVPLDGTLYDEARALGFRFPETLDEWTTGAWPAFALRRDVSAPWLNGSVRKRVRDFESVLNAYYPTVTDLRLHGWRRAVLRTLSGWRYRTGTYVYPVELKLLQKAFRYQRPETTGF